MNFPLPRALHGELARFDMPGLHAPAAAPVEPGHALRGAGLRPVMPVFHMLEPAMPAATKEATATGGVSIDRRPK